MTLKELTTELLHAESMEQILPLREYAYKALAVIIEDFDKKSCSYSLLWNYVQNECTKISKEVCSNGIVGDMQLIQWVGEVGMMTFIQSISVLIQLQEGNLVTKQAVYNYLLLQQMRNVFESLVPSQGMKNKVRVLNNLYKVIDEIGY